MNTAYKLMLLAGLFVLTSSALTAQTVASEKKEDEKSVVVPFELLKSRHMAVEVKINGKGPYRLIFDTGAPTNLINNKLAKEAGVLKKEDKPVMPLFGMGGAKIMDTLEIGDVKMDKVPVMVMDHPTVSAISKALGPIDGIIGFPFFAKYKTTVDYQKRELTFTPNGFVPGDVMQGLMDKLMGPKGKIEPRIVSPAAAWGFTIDKDEKDEDAGVTVKSVVSGSAAAAGGLKPGDRLLTLDGRWTDTESDTFGAASMVKPDRPVVLAVKRDGKEIKLTVKPVKGT